MPLEPGPAAGAAAVSVVPPALAGLDTSPLRDPAGQRLRRILTGTSRYALHTWWRLRRFDRAGSPYLPEGRHDDHVRPMGAVALGLACALRSGGYAEEGVGLTHEEATARAVRLVRSIAAGHRSVSTTSPAWGDGWQTALWGAYAGLAGWLLWDALEPDDRSNVQRMVEAEADRLVAAVIPWYRAPDGRILTPGDTKAEEQSWDARVLHLAMAMQPRHPRWEAWAEAAIRRLVGAYARPSDLANRTPVHGRPLGAWLGGSNAEPDGTLVNHRIIHPDYMVVPHHAAAALHALLADVPVLQAAFTNLDVVYRALVDVPFPSPPHPWPGGFIYVRDSSGIYYPHGTDWGPRRRINFMLNDVQARTLGFDRLASVPASTWERLHAGEVLEMMARFDDGRVYAGPHELNSGQREEEAMERAGQAYLTAWLTARRPPRVTGAPVAGLRADLTTGERAT